MIKGKRIQRNMKKHTKPQEIKQSAAPPREWLCGQGENIFIDRVLAKPSQGAVLIL